MFPVRINGERLASLATAHYRKLAMTNRVWLWEAGCSLHLFLLTSWKQAATGWPNATTVSRDKQCPIAAVLVGLLWVFLSCRGCCAALQTAVLPLGLERSASAAVLPRLPGHRVRCCTVKWAPSPLWPACSWEGGNLAGNPRLLPRQALNHFVNQSRHPRRRFTISPSVTFGFTCPSEPRSRSESR